MVWTFDSAAEWAPAQWWDAGIPHDVPGILRLSSGQHGTFTADVNGARLAVTFVRHGEQRVGCL